MDLKRLRTFVEVADLGTVSRRRCVYASASLSLPQFAVFMPSLHSFCKLHFAFWVVRFRALFFITARAATSETGCGDSANAVKVQGRASYRGEAITNGTVTFFPASGRPVVAALSGEGEYTAELTPGDYVVAIMIGATPPEGYKEGDPLPPPKFTLPDEYTVRAKSTLKVSVKAGQSEPINFELK